MSQEKAVNTSLIILGYHGSLRQLLWVKHTHAKNIIEEVFLFLQMNETAGILILKMQT